MINTKNLKQGDTIWVLVHDWHDGYHNHFKPAKAKFIQVKSSYGKSLYDWIDYSFASNGRKDWALACWCFHTKKVAVEYNKQREI